MLDINITMPIQIINILVLIMILNAILYRPVRGILAEREKRIAALQNDTETLNKNARMRLEEIEKKLRDARARAKEEIEGVRTVVQGEQAEELAKIRKEVDGFKAEQVAQIESQFKDAKKVLAGNVDSFAKEIAAKMLGRDLLDA